MPALVTWFTTTGRTYQLQRYNEVILPHAWEDVDTGITTSEVPYTDTTGVPANYYRVRDDTDDPIFSPYTPQFNGEAVSPSVCSVFGYIFGVDGEPIVNSVVEFRTKELQTTISGQLITRTGYTQTLTDADGYWEQNLIQGIEAHARIADLDMAVLVTIPAVSSVDFSTLI